MYVYYANVIGHPLSLYNFACTVAFIVLLEFVSLVLCSMFLLHACRCQCWSGGGCAYYCCDSSHCHGVFCVQKKVCARYVCCMHVYAVVDAPLSQDSEILCRNQKCSVRGTQCKVSAVQFYNACVYCYRCTQ